ncbi:MAG TPA: efflux RND transporter periplasmic adaptor subunit [Candidatus Angelobacter sp.]|nr:efflux RND transporter periplasmic adaptor subunit [Candidatus Angelobacter sp.]
MINNQNPGIETQVSETDHRHHAARLSSRAKRLLGVGLVVAVLIGLAAGIIPHYLESKEIEKEAERKRHTLPTISVIAARRSSAQDKLSLPGTLSPIEEASIFARASGYIRLRKADMGDHVRPGQMLALIDAPDLDQQVGQARATLSQSESALGQVKAQLNLAMLTRDRFRVLVTKGVLSRQDGDTQEANYEVAAANLQAAENTIKASRANLDRLLKLQQYERVEAPFDGIVTARNVDVGTLISATGSGMGINTPGANSAAAPGSSGTSGSEMFRVAKITRLRVFVSVPEGYVPFIKTGQDAVIESEALVETKFKGKVTRTADSVDQNTRTLLTEVQIDNRNQELLPGMYVTVSLLNVRTRPPVVVPADSLITRSQGTQVAVVRDNIVHLQSVAVGRDYGAFTEILSGVEEGDLVVITPNDVAREGAKVQAKINNPPGHDSATQKASTGNGQNGKSTQQEGSGGKNGGDNNPNIQSGKNR